MLSFHSVVRLPRLAVLLVLCLVAACASDGDTAGGRAAGTTAVNGAGSGGAAGSAGADADNPFGNSSIGMVSEMPDLVVTDDVMDDECPSISRATQPGLAPVDIVWIIDGSFSMVDEAERVQENIDAFVSTISAAGVDTRVVLIAQLDLVPPASGLATSGNYLFVQDDVDSHNALDLLVDRFASYQSFLRPEAHVHFIVVSDDESQYRGLGSADERAAAFRAEMDGLLTADYTLHAVASPGEPGDAACVPASVTPEVVLCCFYCLFICFDAPPAGCEHLTDDNGAPLIEPYNCALLGGAAAPGVTYFRLAEQTAGVATSICAEDWTGVFGSLSDAVIESAPLPCNYPIPEPPPGMIFDRGKVNVRYTPAGMNPDEVAPFPNVESLAACADEAAWYYDNRDAPAEVLLCPSACDAVGAATGGAMDVVFGCDTHRLD